MTLTDDLLLTLGIASIVVSNLACLPYVRDMLTGATRPMRSTWLIWSVLSSICLISNIEKGAGASLFFIGTETAETVLIFLLAIRFGMGSLFQPGDLLIYAFAGAGLILWSYTDDAVYALAIAIAISAIGGSLTILKTYRAPRTETAACWVLSAVSALLGTIAVGEWSAVLLAYPVYLLVLYCAILAAMALGYRRERMERETLALRLAPLHRMPLGAIRA